VRVHVHLYKIVCAAGLRDAILVPCSVTYERLVDGQRDYAAQLSGTRPKQRESVANVLRKWVRALRSPGYGRVYVHFAEPITLTVCVRTFARSLAYIQSVITACQQQSRTPLHKSASSLISLSEDQQRERQLVHDVTMHVLSSR
jgi:glycerol-3-phosphate O-acyltransferase